MARAQTIAKHLGLCSLAHARCTQQHESKGVLTVRRYLRATDFSAFEPGCAIILFFHNNVLNGFNDATVMRRMKLLKREPSKRQQMFPVCQYQRKLTTQLFRNSLRGNGAVAPERRLQSEAMASWSLLQ
jgi:hypothetical protein